MRLADARRDPYRRLAQNQGYRSRSAYKLIQLNRSYNVLKKGMSVLDLGCAPGGWVQVAKDVVGGAGKVVGIDIKHVDPIGDAILLHGSIEDQVTIEKAIQSLQGKADVLLSDLSPNVSGVWDVDHARQISLTIMALRIAKQVLKSGGDAVFKIFEGCMLEELKRELRKSFERVALSKPNASRKESSELYVVCFNFRPSFQDLYLKP